MLRSGSLTTPCSKEQIAGDEDSFITICALSKFASNNRGSDGASNWRAKFNSQRGAVLATEKRSLPLDHGHYQEEGVEGRISECCGGCRLRGIGEGSCYKPYHQEPDVGGSERGIKKLCRLKATEWI
ncbi:hypothetical protein BY996DRAFT_8548414 [Phakopsora pachyrhizi]|nr:hypothetical protein BY996DRAFT_8548414 [Phakopsora pachyrhizi]